MNRISLLLYIILSMLAYSSCRSEDGDWELMKWKTDADIKKGTVDVPVDGGTYVFTCKNYNLFWLSSVLENERSINIDIDKGKYATGEWSCISIAKNVMTVTISKNNNSFERILTVDMTAGDVFSSFTFRQK